MKIIIILLTILCSGCISTMDVELYALNVKNNISACKEYIRFSGHKQLTEGTWIELSGFGSQTKLNTTPLFLGVSFIAYKGHSIELISNKVSISHEGLTQPIQTQFRVISYIGAEDEPCLSCKKPFERGFKMIGADISPSYVQQAFSTEKSSARHFGSEIKIPKIDKDHFSISFSDIKADGQLMKVPPFHFSRQQLTLPNGHCGVAW